jgi:hypothetical protein
MTLFAALDVLPVEHMCVVWDMFFVDGWKAMFRVALALLEAVADDLLNCDFSVIVKCLNTYPPRRVPSIPKLLSAACSFKVTNRCVCSAVC